VELWSDLLDHRLEALRFSLARLLLSTQRVDLMVQLIDRDDRSE
jgi:hypothetical protein